MTLNPGVSPNGTRPADMPTTAASNRVPPPTSSAGLTDTVLLSKGDDTKCLDYPQRSTIGAPPPEPTVLQPETGTRIGTYFLQEKLGEGVSCHVFRGLDEALQQSVALKILNWANVYDRAAAMKQLRMEAVALSRVKHPSVVRFFDFGFDPRWPYLVTEYVPGAPLGEFIRDGVLPVRWSLYLISQMVDALGAVWQAGLVHRDIKPDNILVGPQGEAKLIDFGLAKSAALQAKDPRPGPELAGTAAYLAPEQAKDASLVDHRADIYSLGVALYQCLTGQLPFDGRNRMKVIYQHMNTPPAPPIERMPELPSLASDLCLWMLAKNPADRPQNHDELRQAFDTVMASVK
jgi:serine/threonine protein kinase